MSTLKFIHAADLHLDSPFSALSPEEARTRRQGQRAVIAQIAREAVGLGAQAVILSGDCFEEDAVSEETAQEFCRRFGALALPVFVCTGNHDPYFPGCIWDRMKLPENVHLFKQEKFTCAEYPEINARFWGAGFEKAFCPPLLKDFQAPEKIDGVFDIMVLHGDLGAEQSDYCPLTMAQLEASGMDYVALGHIHMRSSLSFAGKTAYAYPGCARGRGFDELGKKGFYLVNLSENGAQADFVPLKGEKYDVIKVDVSDTQASDAVEAALAGTCEDDHVRVILMGETDEPLDIGALRKGLSKKPGSLQICDETAIRRDIWASLNRDGLEGLFLRKLREKLDAASSEEEQKTIALAAKYGVMALEGGEGRLL